MCGIVGYVGSTRAAEYVLEGLKKLEYRGYDSSGIATVADDKIYLARRKGKLIALSDAIRDQPLPGQLAIGHTRWATHGAPSETNAHPHQVDDVVLVHNGIIENFLQLTEQLRTQGRELKSQTDTEIISHLVAMESGTLMERVRGALAQVRGAYAIAVICDSEPNSMVVAKNASPLIVGITDDCAVVASDIPALLPHTRDVIILEQGHIALLSPGHITLETLEGKTLIPSPKRIDWSPVMAEKGGHKHFMHKEIFEQPRAVSDALRGRLGSTPGELLLDSGMIDNAAKAQRILLTACGTSYYAAMVGRLLIEELSQVSCEVDLASELRYRTPLLNDKTLVIAVSQSGETADTLAAVHAAKGLGSKVTAIVNVLGSSISREADSVLYTNAGPEIGVASTKAFVTQVIALTLFAVALGLRKGLATSRAAEIIAGLREIPSHIETILKCEKKIIAVAHRLVKAKSTLFLGRGYGYPVALEGALKLKEISYIHAEGNAAGEMKHGPIALIDAELPSIFIATNDPLYEKVVSNLQEVKARDGVVVAIATEGDTHIEKIADEVIFIPKVAPLLSPLLTVVPLQLLAYHVADLRGTDIDQPRNLAKSVTVE